MATRGRKAGFQMSDAHRVKIQNSNILNALLEHVEGKREMSSTQVTTGIALMKKVLPDLSSVTLEGGEKPIKTEDVTQGAAKVAAYLDAISQRKTSDPAED